MRRFFKSGWFKALIVLVVVLIAGAIFAVASKDKTSPFSTAVGAVFQPLQRATSYVGNGFKNFGGKFRTLKGYEKQVKDLQSKVDKYEKELVDYENSKQKLKEYEEFYKIKDKHKDYIVEPAIVIGRDAANAYGSIVLNKGKSDDIKKNDPVIRGNGQVVGVVTKVGATYCVVSTIYDSDVKISAYEIKTRETGFSTTTAKLASEKLCRLSGLNRTTTIATGGIVCTSGVGSVYPRDLIIGTVKDVENENRDISSYAVIEPGFDITKLENVLIITDFDGQGTSITED